MGGCNWAIDDTGVCRVLGGPSFTEREQPTRNKDFRKMLKRIFN